MFFQHSVDKISADCFSIGLALRETIHHLPVRKLSGIPAMTADEYARLLFRHCHNYFSMQDYISSERKKKNDTNVTSLYVSMRDKHF